MANPNPDQSGLTPFPKGVSPNPGGKTSAQRKREIANAERATRLRARMLVALEKSLDAAKMEDGTADALAALGIISADTLRLLKDTEDRGFGAPTSKVEGPGENGEHIVSLIRIVAEDGAGDD